MGQSESSHGEEKARLVSKRVHSGEYDKIIQELREEQTERDKEITIDRSELKNVGISLMKTPKIEYSPFNIKFTSGSKAENVVDLGGPTREFFTLLMDEFKKPDLGMFEGIGGFLLPVNNKPFISNGVFQGFGKAVVISALHGGPGFPYFPPFIISFLRGREFEHELSTLYIINSYLKNYIDEIHAADCQEELDQTIGQDEERFMDNCGWPVNERVTLGNRIFYTQTLLQWDLIDKRLAALTEIKTGLNCLGFLDKVNILPEFEHLLYVRNKTATTAKFIKEKLTPKVVELETRNDLEEKAKKFTIGCLEDLEDREASVLFQFITGLDDVPTHDFIMQVGFNTQNRNAKLPEAITCIQKLLLPLGNKSKLEFFSSFAIALQFGAVGFDEGK